MLEKQVTRTPAATVMTYPETSDITRTLIGNEIVDHSDVFAASPVGAALTTRLFWSQLSPDFNKLRKDTCKGRLETFKLWDLVRLILHVRR